MRSADMLAAWHALQEAAKPRSLYVPTTSTEDGCHHGEGQAQHIVCRLSA